MNAPAAPNAIAETHAAASEVERDIALARTGTMDLGALMTRAEALNRQGHADASARLYESWIASTQSPLRYVACFNWGTVLGLLRRHAEAEKAYLAALAFAPDFHQARLNLAHQYEHLGRPEEALAEWQRVIDASPNPQAEQLTLHLHALNNRARLLETLRRYDQAAQCMRASLELKPNQVDVIQHFVHLRQKMCDWPIYAPVGELTHNHLLCGTSTLAMLSASDDPALQLMSAKRFVHEKITRADAEPLHLRGPKRDPNAKIKIGYLSGDLCLHAVGLLTAELLELHDRKRFEVYAFCWSRDDGMPLTARLRRAMDHHIRIGHLDDTQAAQLIAAHGIDVLVDLQGLTSGARPNIVAQRPAPVQVSYLGLPGTSALPGVDWVIADRFVMPEALQPYMTEKPLYVPRCYQVSDRQRAVGAMPTRAQYGLPEDAFVFCSFNNNFKFTGDVFQSWMRILQAVPNSVLWLLADNEWAHANMLKEADAHGVARERLILAPRVAPPDYLARFQLADLMLDTFPYNAGTTASDALWMGLPIVTWSGRSYISRMAGSLLTAVGLPDLIATSLDAYERLAVTIGQNPKRAASYRRYLNEHGRTSDLFNVPQLVRDIETQFERVVLEQRQKGMP